MSSAHKATLPVPAFAKLQFLAKQARQGSSAFNTVIHGTKTSAGLAMTYILASYVHSPP